jgi:hypothetical protein
MKNLLVITLFALATTQLFAQNSVPNDMHCRTMDRVSICEFGDGSANVTTDTDSFWYTPECWKAVKVLFDTPAKSWLDIMQEQAELSKTMAASVQVPICGGILDKHGHCKKGKKR